MTAALEAGVMAVLDLLDCFVGRVCSVVEDGKPGGSGKMSALDLVGAVVVAAELDDGLRSTSHCGEATASGCVAMVVVMCWVVNVKQACVGGVAGR